MGNSKLGKFSVVYPNEREYHLLKREIWGQDCYHFESSCDKPYLIDVGSHIGISILYFKALYPKSEIVAFEPGLENIQYLEENIAINGLEDITVIPKAVWKENGKRSFYIDATENGWNSNASLLMGSWSGKENTKEVEVECVKLDEYIKDRVVDCLKIDTEGSEIVIVKSIRRFFSSIKVMFIEYHPSKGNSVKELDSLLRGTFNIEYYSEGKLLKKPVEGKLLTVKCLNKSYL